MRKKQEAGSRWLRAEGAGSRGERAESAGGRKSEARSGEQEAGSGEFDA